MTSTVFKSLADTTFDSVEGYRKAHEKAKSAQLKQALQQRLEKRQQTLGVLNAQLERQGDELVTKGTATGGLHRLWVDITDLFEEGEDYIKDKFEKALEGDDLEAGERAIVQQCLAEISEGERFGDMIEKQYD